PVLPPDRLAEEQGDLAARAEDALLGDPLDGLLVTDQPGRRGRVGGEDEVVEGADPVHSIVAVADRAPFRVNPFDPGSELEFDPDLAVDRRQPPGEPPRPRFTKPEYPPKHPAEAR